MKQIWLNITESVQIGVSMDWAMTATERDFMHLYREHVYGASRREAKLWARKQVEEREKHLALVGAA